MTALAPDFRFTNVKAALDNEKKASSLDQYESVLYLYLKGALGVSDALKNSVKSVVERYNNKTHRKIITGLIIAGCTVDEITKITGLDKKTVHLYSKLFFDDSTFSNRLDIWSYVESEVEDEELLDFYLHSFRMGPEFIRWNMGTQKYDISHKDMAQDILYEVYMKSKSCLIKQLEVNTVKQWTGITHQYIRLVEDLDSDVKNPLEDLIFKLKESGESKTVDDFNRDDIV